MANKSDMESIARFQALLWMFNVFWVVISLETVFEEGILKSPADWLVNMSVLKKLVEQFTALVSDMLQWNI